MQISQERAEKEAARKAEKEQAKQANAGKVFIFCNYLFLSIWYLSIHFQEEEQKAQKEADKVRYCYIFKGLLNPTVFPYYTVSPVSITGSEGSQGSRAEGRKGKEGRREGYLLIFFSILSLFLSIIDKIINIL